MRTPRIKTVRLREVTKLPKSMRFSHIAYPGSLAELVSIVIDGKSKGELFEYYADERLIGVGVIAQIDPKTSMFIVDVTKRGLSAADIVIARTAGAAQKWRVKKVQSTIPKDQLSVFNSAVKWSSEMSTNIPVTRLL